MLIVGNYAAGYPETLSVPRFAAKVRGLEWKPGERLAAWKRRSASQEPLTVSKRGLASLASFRGVTWLSALLSFVAMWLLVHGTGGGIESPYAPLLLGPAILGPIVVMDARALIPLGLLAAIWVTATDATSSKAPDVAKPGWLVYTFVSLFVVTWVLLITTIQLTEPRLTTPRQNVSLAASDDDASEDQPNPLAEERR